MKELKHTKGPWRWEYSAHSKTLHLCGGIPTYDLFVMSFVREGMQGATIMLREDVDKMNIMEKASKWAIPVKGREHHKSWFQDINHPDAKLISSAPELLEALMNIVGWDEKYPNGKQMNPRELS